MACLVGNYSDLEYGNYDKTFTFSRLFLINESVKVGGDVMVAKLRIKTNMLGTKVLGHSYMEAPFIEGFDRLHGGDNAVYNRYEMIKLIKSVDDCNIYYRHFQDLMCKFDAL